MGKDNWENEMVLFDDDLHKRMSVINHHEHTYFTPGLERKLAQKKFGFPVHDRYGKPI